MSNKYYKNPGRVTNETVPKYVPQYKIHDLEPQIHATVKVPSNTIISSGSELNPRDKRPAIRQEVYAPIPEKTKINSIPNVGNSMSTSWSGVDGELIDEVILDPNAKMKEHSNETLDAMAMLEEQKKSEQPNENSLISSLYELNEGDFVLLVQGILICSGELEDLEKEVRALLLGDDPIDVEDILVLKRSKIKMGVFLE